MTIPYKPWRSTPLQLALQQRLRLLRQCNPPQPFQPILRLVPVTVTVSMTLRVVLAIRTPRSLFCRSRPARLVLLCQFPALLRERAKRRVNVRL